MSDAGDWSGKHRPILELIARMSGKSAGFEITPGGTTETRDAEVAAGVAVTRRFVTHAKRKDKDGNPKTFPAPTCVRPELLLLKYAMQFEYVPHVSRMCAAVVVRKLEAEVEPRLIRHAAYLATQHVAGRPIGKEQVLLAAWSVDVDANALNELIGRCAEYLQGELHEAEVLFCKAMRRWIPDAERRAVDEYWEKRERAA